MASIINNLAPSTRPQKNWWVAAAEKYLYSFANRGFELDPHPQGLKPETARTAQRHD
jgi:hypothetical protein